MRTQSDERAIANFARASNGGLIVPGGALASRHRDLIVTLAAQHKLPAVYFERAFVTGEPRLLSPHASLGPARRNMSDDS